jgi:hypothetical protein
VMWSVAHYSIVRVNAFATVGRTAGAVAVGGLPGTSVAVQDLVILLAGG